MDIQQNNTSGLNPLNLLQQLSNIETGKLTRVTCDFLERHYMPEIINIVNCDIIMGRKRKNSVKLCKRYVTMVYLNILKIRRRHHTRRKAYFVFTCTQL